MTARIKRIPISDLHIEPQAQRSLRPSWVQTLADEFDEDKLGIIHVGSNGTGTYYILDGQHRVAALREAGYDDDYEVLCYVREDTHRKDRASLFLALNSTRNVRAYDKFKVRVTEGDPVACEIKDIVESIGLHVLDQKKDGCVTAVTALEAVYRGSVLRLTDNGPFPEILRETLKVLYRAYGDDASAYNGPLIKGVGSFLLRFGDEIDANRLSDKLIERGGPNKLLGDARGLKDMKRVTLRNAVADILVDTYNHRLRSNQLPPWDRA